MKKAAIYCRVSSDKQAREGDSIQAQLSALHKYIDDHPDLICAGDYIDDGISGTKYSQRDELQRLLADVRAGKINIILFTKLDRWYRSVRHYTATQETLDKYGVGWLAIWEPIYDTTTPSGRLIVNQMMSIAQFEAENTGQRIRQVFDYKAKKGEVLSGSCPPGYSIVEKHLVPNDNAFAVLEAFKDYSRTGSLSKTMLLASGKGLPRAQPAFKKMLMNRKYIGQFRENKHYCQPIVPMDLFEDVQRKLAINVKKSQKNVYIFSGLIRCKECGSVLGANTRRRQRGNSFSVIYQYRCPKHYNWHPHICQNAKLVTESALEKYLVAHLSEKLEGLRLEYTAEQTEPRDTARQRSSIEGKLSRLKELFINGLITMDEYKTDRERLEEELSKIADPPAKDEYKALDIILPDGFEAIYADLSREERRFFWRSVIKEIRFGIDRQYDFIFL